MLPSQLVCHCDRSWETSYVCRFMFEALYNQLFHTRLAYLTTSTRRLVKAAFWLASIEIVALLGLSVVSSQVRITEWVVLPLFRIFSWMPFLRPVFPYHRYQGNFLPFREINDVNIFRRRSLRFTSSASASSC